MIRVLLDTNVILDFLMDRQPFADVSAAIWRANDAGRITAYVSVITPVNVFYIARKLQGAEIAPGLVQSLLNACRICSLGRSALLSALALPVKDFEDAVQVVSAQEEALDALVTRDTGDYKSVSFPIFSPDEFLKHFDLE